MKVLLTGGTGQLGAALADALVERGDTVCALVRDRHRLGQLQADVELVSGDVRDPDAVTKASRGVEAVLHCAGLVSYWPRRADQIWRVNVVGTQVVLDAAREAGARRILLTSSIAALGFVEGDGEGDEDCVGEDTGIPYIDTKREAERRVLGASGIEGVAVNPGIVLGAGDARENGGRTLLRLHRGQMPAAPSGSTTMCNLSDCVAGHLAALDQGRAGERYVLGGTTGSFKALFDRLAAQIDAEWSGRVIGPAGLYAFGAWLELLALFRKQEPGMTRSLSRVSSANRMYSSAKVARELGYQPRPIEVGAQACWDWYRADGRVS